MAADPLVVQEPTYKPGDTWIYDRTHEAGKNHFAQERVVEKIERVGSDNLLFGFKLDGSPDDFSDIRVGLDLSQQRVVDGRSMTTERLFSFPMKIGDTWQEDFVDPRRQGLQTSAHVQGTYKVIGWEDVTVPAGTFRALKIEANGMLTAHVEIPATAVSGAAVSPSGGASASRTQPARSVVVGGPTYRAIWFVPSIKTYVKLVHEQYDSENVRTKRDVSVLASFKPGD